MLTYLFLRLKATSALEISNALNSAASLGYEVVSHAESQEEYSFVMARHVEQPTRSPAARTALKGTKTRKGRK